MVKITGVFQTDTILPGHGVSETLVNNSQTLVEISQTFVKISQTLVKISQTLVKNYQTLVKFSQTLVKISQTFVNFSQTLDRLAKSYRSSVGVLISLPILTVVTIWIDRISENVSVKTNCENKTHFLCPLYLPINRIFICASYLINKRISMPISPFKIPQRKLSKLFDEI